MRLLTSAILALAAVGCVDPCEDLQPICDACLDPNHKAACELAVDDGVADACELDLDYYENICQ